MVQQDIYNEIYINPTECALNSHLHPLHRAQLLVMYLHTELSRLSYQTRTSQYRVVR